MKKCRVQSGECGIKAAVGLRNFRSSILDPRIRYRRGFSFVEIMFAVVLLGIGFIMLAAVFPVGIRQQQETIDADTATGVANAAHAVVVAQPIATYPNTLPLQVNHVPLSMTAMQGSQISAGDQRFAWTVLWSWTSAAVPAPGDIATFYYFVLRSRNRDFFDPAMVQYDITPRSVNVQAVTYDPLGSTIEFSTIGPGVKGTDLAESGAFVVIASSTVPASIGKVYRLSNRVTDGVNTIWYLSPDFTPGSVVETFSGVGNTAYMVGRGLDDPYSTPGTFSGPARDIALVKKTYVYPTP